MQSNTCKDSFQAKRCVLTSASLSVFVSPVITIQYCFILFRGSFHRHKHSKYNNLCFLYIFFFFFFILAGKSSCLFVGRRDQRGQVEAVRADVPLASSLPGLVSTVTFHLKEGIYSVQSVCHRVCWCVSAWRYTNSHVRVCVCVCAGAFTGYSNSSCSHWPRNKISLFLQC